MKKEKIILLFSFVILFTMTLEVNAKPTISAPYFYKQMGGIDSLSDSVSSKYSYFNQILNNFVTEGGSYIKDENLYNLDVDIVNNNKATKQYNLVATADPAKGSWGKKDLELLYEEAKKGNHIKFEILAYNEGLRWESMSSKLGSNSEVYDEFLFTFEVFCFMKNLGNEQEISYLDFVEYYTPISTSIINDNYFDDILLGAWNIEENILQQKNVDYDTSYEVLAKRCSKSVDMLSMSGEFIRQFPSIRKATKYIIETENKPYKHIFGIEQHIINVCQGKRNSAYNYKWKYSNVV